MRAVLACAALNAALAWTSGAIAQRYEPNGGIGKYKVPKRHTAAEFDGGDVMNAASGKHIRAEFSVNILENRQNILL